MKTPETAKPPLLSGPAKLDRGRVWCTVCGNTQMVNAKAIVWFSDGMHWPKCCGYTMTIDSPEEREAMRLITKNGRAKTEEKCR